MQDKLKNKIKSVMKKFSFVTTHPDSDWMKVFGLLFIIALLSLCWNIYFYFSVKHDITVSSQATEVKVETGATAEEQINEVIDIYETRGTAHRSVILMPPPGVPDPAGAVIQ